MKEIKIIKKNDNISIETDMHPLDAAHILAKAASQMIEKKGHRINNMISSLQQKQDMLEREIYR